MNFPEFGDIEVFVRDINDGLDRNHISRDDLAMMDHVCYRVETVKRYNTLLREFGEHARLLDESIVSGRMIATFEFPEPLEVGGWRVPYLELPQPKENSPYPEGLEHAEFVVVGSLERFQRQYAGLAFDEKGMSKPINPELGLKDEGMSVKFHEQPLGAVTRIEQQLARQVAEESQARESI